MTQWRKFKTMLTPPMFSVRSSSPKHDWVSIGREHAARAQPTVPVGCFRLADSGCFRLGRQQQPLEAIRMRRCPGQCSRAVSHAIYLDCSSTIRPTVGACTCHGFRFKFKAAMMPRASERQQNGRQQRDRPIATRAQRAFASWGTPR